MSPQPPSLTMPLGRVCHVNGVVFFFNDVLASVYIHFGLSACLLIGPFLFCYVTSTQAPVGKSERFRVSNLLFWLPIILIINIAYPWDTELYYWREFFIPFIYIQWLCYLLASGWILRNVIHHFFMDGYPLKNMANFWVISIFVSNIIIWFSYGF